MHRNDDAFTKVCEEISALLQKKSTVLIAIDGRCASGKTTLAEKLSHIFDCNIFHLDDFFLRPEQRTEKRLSEVGGNVDRERFEIEALQNLVCNKAFSYRPFNCTTQDFDAPITVSPKNITIIEGSYSCHPALFSYYDLHIFLTVAADEQRHRIRIRNGEAKAEVFRTRWIPMEEKYFDAFDIKSKCEIVMET